MFDKEKNFISAIVYIHNCEDSIQEFLKALGSKLEENFEHSEIICVNDFSTDQSVQRIKDFRPGHSNVSITVLNMSYFHGLELSMNAGLDISIGDFVFEFDSTSLDYDISEIMNVYRKSQEGYDIVALSPDSGNGLFSSLFYKTFNHFASFQYKLSSESFRILSRRVINRIGSMSKTIPYRKAVYANSGLKTTRLFYKRECGTVHPIDRSEKKFRRHLAFDSLVLFTDVGYKFSIYMALTMIGVAVAMLVYSVVIYITCNPIEGWTTTILFLSFAFFGLFSVLTVIIKYLQILIELIFKRKSYCFESIEKLT